MSYRVRTLVLLIIGLASATSQSSTNIKATVPSRPGPASTAAESIELIASVGGGSSTSDVDGSLLYINEYDKLTIIDAARCVYGPRTHLPPGG